MALNPLGVLDLSIVTDLLISVLTAAWHNSPLWASLSPDSYFFPTIGGATPESVRPAGGCQLTLTLIHIEPNKYQRNFVFPPTAPPSPQPPSPRAQTIPSLPLSLDLFYFVSAYAENNYHQEQQAMSIVLNCFHQNPIIRTSVTIPGSPSETQQEEFTLTMEIETADSISRLWQAITAPFRLSLLYRVAAVFLTPPEPPDGAPPVRTYGLTVAPTTFPFAANGQLFGSSSTAAILSPDGVTNNVHYSPATVVPGQNFILCGSGLADPSFKVFLLDPPDYQGGQDVTAAWNGVATADRFRLQLPTAPTGSPLVDVPGSPPNPILQAQAGVYTVNGIGFVPGTTAVLSEEVPNTQVLLETVALTPAAGPLSQGAYMVNSPTQITFQPPANLPPGRYGVRVRVNAVESPPALWIEIP